MTDSINQLISTVFNNKKIEDNMKFLKIFISLLLFYFLSL